MTTLTAVTIHRRVHLLKARVQRPGCRDTSSCAKTWSGETAENRAVGSVSRLAPATLAGDRRSPGVTQPCAI
jgi:hypothetical protein